jgi:hypothetical protein
MEMFNPEITAEILSDAPEWKLGWPDEPGFYWVQLICGKTKFEQVEIRLAYIDSDGAGLIYPPDGIRSQPSIDIVSRDMLVAFTIRTILLARKVNNGK